MNVTTGVQREVNYGSECYHDNRNVYCDHCKKKLCGQCELLHKFHIKKDIEEIISKSKQRLEALKVKESERVDEILRQHENKIREVVNEFMALKLHSIASFNIRERCRLENEGKRITEERVAPCLAILNKAKSCILDKMTSAEREDLVVKLENLNQMLLDPSFVKGFSLLKNEAREEILQKFLNEKVILTVERNYPQENVPRSPPLPLNPKATNVDATIYKQLRIVTVISGTDKFLDIIHSPTGVARVIIGGEKMFAIVHGCRISFFSLSGKLCDTLKVKNSEIGAGFLLSGDISSDIENGILYLGARSGGSSCIYKIDLKSEKKSYDFIVPEVFMKLDGRISGLDVCLYRQELYAMVGNEIQAFSLRKATKLPFSVKAYHGSSIGHSAAKLQCVLEGNGYLAYTKEAGREVWLLNLSSKQEIRLLKQDTGNNFTDIRGVAGDTAGNIVIVDRHTPIKVVSANAPEYELACLDMENKNVDLRGVNLWVMGNKLTVVITDHASNRIVFFSN